MNNVSVAEQRPQRLTTLIYTDSSPFLPLPRAPAPPCSPVDFCSAADQALAQQDSSFDQAARLLLDVDLSHIEVRYGQDAVGSRNPPAVGSVHARLHAEYPELFDCSGVRVAASAVSPLQQGEQLLLPNAASSSAVTPHASKGLLSIGHNAQSPPSSSSLHASNVIATKRKRSVRQPRKAPAAQLGGKEAAGACTATISRWLSDSEAKASDANGDNTPSRPLPRQLRDIADAIGRARAASVLKDVDPALLRKAIGVLSAVMRTAEVQIVSPASEGSAGDQETDAAAAAGAGVDAAVAVLHIAAEPGLPRHMLAEETLQQVANLLRVQLQQNVVPFYNPRLQRLLRPGLSDGGIAVQATGNKRAKVMKATALCLRVPDGAKHILRRLEVALAVVPAMVAAGGRIPSDALIRLLKALSQALTVATLDVLHVQAAGVLVAVFCHMLQHRLLLLEEIVSGIMPHIQVPKPSPRAAATRLDACPDIHIVIRMFLQMTQGAVQLPSTGASAKALQGCFTPAVVAADRFWTLQLERLNSDGVGKNERDASTKLWIERSISDVLAVLNCLEWPSASLAVNRLISLLRTKPSLSVASPNVALRQMYVELLGTMAAALLGDGDCSDADRPWVLGLLADSRTDDNGSENASRPELSEEDASSHVRRLMLQHLSLEAGAGNVSAASAIEFVVARSTSEQAVLLLAKGTVSPEEAAAVLLHYRGEAAEVMHSHITDLAPGDAIRLGRFIVQHGILGRIRASPLKWLQECVEDAQQAAVVRCKAVKALRTIVQSSPGVLAQPAVMQALSHALQDSSKVVREAAIELLGRHIGTDGGTAAEYFDHFVAATCDVGVGVRKRALQILWDSCIRLPDFPRATDACVVVLRCHADSEDSVRQLVSRIFQDLWFSPDSGESAGSSAAKARQLAQVAVACYGTDSFYLPLDPQSPLVSVLAAALRNDGVKKRRWEEGSQIAAALLEDFLSSQEAGDEYTAPGSDQAVAPLLALHALSLADASVCLPRKDPSLFVRSLTPYLKMEGFDQSSAQTHCLLSVLAVLSAVVPRLEHLNTEITQEMAKDLWLLAARQLQFQISASTCETFAHLATLSPQIAGRYLAQLATKYITALAGPAPALDKGYLSCWSGSEVPPEKLAFVRASAPRFLFVVGKLWRYGCESLENAAAAEETMDDSETPAAAYVSLQRCLDVFFAFYQLPVGEIALQDAALRALGQLFIARPGLMLLERSVAVTTSALLPTAPLVLKHRILVNLAELLKAEQDRQVRMGDAAAGAAPGLQAVKSAGGDVDHESAAAIAAHNGEGDSVGVRSGVLQANWESIVRLATEVGSAADEPGKADLVRRRAAEVIDAVCKAGLVPPWKPVPALVVLSTDSQQDVARSARLLLTRQSTLPGCSAGEFQTYLASGVPLAHQFHARLAAVNSKEKDITSGSAPSAALLSGMAAIYSKFVQPARGAPGTFLSALLRRFDTAATVSQLRPVPTDLRLLSTCAQLVAVLPFKNADEPLAALTSLSAIISRRGDAALDALRAALKCLPSATNATEGSPHADVASPAGPRNGSGTAASAGSTTGGKGTLQRESAAQQAPPGLEAACSAAVAVSMLLMLKKFLLDAYSLVPQRVALFAAGNAEKRKTEEKTAVSCGRGIHHHLEELRLDCASDVTLATQQFRILRHQMKEDAAMYIGSLTTSEEGTPGGATTLRRGANTAVKAAAGGSSARVRRQAATTGGKVRGSQLARAKQVDSDADMVHAAATPGPSPAPRRLRL